MDMRRILLAAAAQSAGDLSERLQAQADEVDLVALQNIVDRMETRAEIIHHAASVMIAGVHPHPMHAYLHATECIKNNDGSRISDSEFFHLLTTWGRLCEQAHRSHTAVNVTPLEPGAFNHFADRFMKGE